jgi:hypothetical protein
MSAVGLRVKSGYAIAVVLDGSRAAPRAVARHVVDLSDPAVAASRQPYHDGFFRTEEDTREIARRVAVVKRCARKSVRALVMSLEPESPAHRRRGEGGSGRLHATLVVGSLIDPRTVTNPHIRAHAHEGRLFRTVLEDALRTHEVHCAVVVDKQLIAHASKTLERPPAAIARTVAAFGKSLGGPWRAEEKAAATAAWLVLPR